MESLIKDDQTCVSAYNVDAGNMFCEELGH